MNLDHWTRLMESEHTPQQETPTAPRPQTAAVPESGRALRTVIGISGASGTVHAVDFVKRCPGDKYLIASKWSRALLHQELGMREHDLDPYVNARFSDTDLAAPLSSGSNPFDTFIILPCSASTVGKIAAGIADTLITRTAMVALKEKRRLVIAIRETPLSTQTLEALHKLSQDGAVVFPLMPPWYKKPQDLQELVSQTTDRLLGACGIEVPGGWREGDL